MRALALRNPRPAAWHDGIEAAYKSSTAVFIAPPLHGWSLCPGSPLFGPADRRPPGFGALAEQLATELNAEVQYFCTHRIVEAHAWARATLEGLVRAYCYIGESGETLVNFGAPTLEERELGFAFFDKTSPEANHDEYWDREDLSFPTEDNVVRLADRWSLDPTKLNEPPAADGLLGDLGVAKPGCAM